MPFVIGDRVLETTITLTGTGSVTLNGAVSGYRAFSTVATANNDTFYYQIAGATEWEVGLGTRTSATVFARTTVYASSNGGALVNFTAGTKEVWMDAAAEQLRMTMNLNAHSAIYNGSILCSVAANAATFAVRNAAGAVPSTTDPVFLIFQTSTGTSTVVRIAAALTITIASGATMGFQANMPGRIWLAVLLNAGVAELVVRNCTTEFGLGSGANLAGFTPGLISTTTQAGSGDDSPLVSYSVTARSAVPYFILGYFDWDDTPLVTPGAWATNPNKTIMMNANIPLPGSILQTLVNAQTTGISATSATWVSVVALTVTRQSKCNTVKIEAFGGSMQTVVSGTQVAIKLINTTQAYDLSAQCTGLQTSGVSAAFWWPVSLISFDFPGTTLANAYEVQVSRPTGTGTVIYPVSGSGFSWITAQEIMG